jgi:hypothetical protein
MFSVGIIQQAGDTGSALATLVCINIILGVCIELMIFCYCQGHRCPHFYSCLLGDTPPPIFRCLYCSWDHLAVYWALHCYNRISSYPWIQLLRKSCWSESFPCMDSLSPIDGILRQYWCWIGNHYKTEQYVGQYVWVWATMFISFLTYTPLFFWARGNITVSTTHWWKFRIHKEAIQTIDPDGRKRRSIGMIAFVYLTASCTL